MLQKSLLLSLLLLGLSPVLCKAQLGGSRVMNFLSLPANAHTSALGGNNVSATGSPGLIWNNPALLDTSMHQQALLSYQPFFADISHTVLSYSRQVGTSGMWHAGLRFFNYGDINGFDPTGQATGTFDAAEYSLQLGHSRQSGPFRLGATLRFAASRISSDAASALALDLGAVFVHPKQDFSIGLAVQNLGFVVVDYAVDNSSQLPLDVQVGASLKPTYMPVRFHLTAANLNRGNISFFDPSGVVDPEAAAPGSIDQLFRRLNLGLEFLFSQNFHFRAGYNHLIRQELKLPQASGGAGFSFGLMLRVSRFRMEFTRQIYHAVGGRTFLTLQTDLQGKLSKKAF